MSFSEPPERHPLAGSAHLARSNVMDYEPSKSRRRNPLLADGFELAQCEEAFGFLTGSFGWTTFAIPGALAAAVLLDVGDFISAIFGLLLMALALLSGTFAVIRLFKGLIRLDSRHPLARVTILVVLALFSTSSSLLIALWAPLPWSFRALVLNSAWLLLFFPPIIIMLIAAIVASCAAQLHRRVVRACALTAIGCAATGMAAQALGAASLLLPTSSGSLSTGAAIGALLTPISWFVLFAALRAAQNMYSDC